MTLAIRLINKSTNRPPPRLPKVKISLAVTFPAVDGLSSRRSSSATRQTVPP
jgi:hypothetical protein